MSEAGFSLGDAYFVGGKYPGMPVFGETIVEIDVTEDFSGELPERISVLTTTDWCCRCWNIGKKAGNDVATIVQVRRDGLFRLLHSDLFSDDYGLGSFLIERFLPTCMKGTVHGRWTLFCSEFQREIERSGPLPSE